MPQRLVLIIESDTNSIAQMRRVVAGMGLRAFAVSDEAALQDLVSSLRTSGTPPDLIVARVALPTGSGIRLNDETSAQFPNTGCLLVSHHPRSLLSSVPGFQKHSANFLKAEFTDDQFRLAVERALPRTANA